MSIAGALACAGFGTAIGVISSAWDEGKKIHIFVFVDFYHKFSL